MKNIENEEKALQDFDRNPALLLIMSVLSLLIVGYAYLLLKNVEPLGFLVMVPGAILFFQSLWLLLHPFAQIFANKIEIKQSFIHKRIRYFVDIRKITVMDNGKMYITYNDDEIEPLSLFGIHPSQRNQLIEKFRHNIHTSLEKRSQPAG